MGLKSFLSKPTAKFFIKKAQKAYANPIQAQEKVFNHLIESAKNTEFGKDHDFGKIKSYSDFKQYVPIVDYEQLKPYIEKMVDGQANILWKGKPVYFAKTSGTTSGAKYIPISKESMPYHIKSARNALLSYIKETKKSSFVNGKMIFLQGSPKLYKKNGVNIGRLSGIVAHHVPGYLQKNRMPSFETNCIDDWETKIDEIVKETINENMTLISGIPSWVQMYFEKIIEKGNVNNVKQLFPNFSLFVYGGVNYEPYRNRMNELIGENIDTIETYPASEGFIAYQNSQKEKGLLLEVDSGMFYEFIPTDEYFNENPTRISLKDVELNKNYAIILNTCAGLWGYSIGDTVKFVSKNPYKILVTGRIKHYISAFGEHVIGEEVERAISQACKEFNCNVIEFTVAPQVNPVGDELPYHEWFIEFDLPPNNLKEFTLLIDKLLQSQNIYYKDLIEGNILQPAIIRTIKKGGFNEAMKKKGKLGGQNKIPKLKDDREFAELLKSFVV